MGLVGALGMSIAAVVPAAATAGDDVTGDITDPVLVSMSLSASTVDVTDGPAEVVVTIRATDDQTGVRQVWLAYTRPGFNGGIGINVVRIAGNDADGVYEGRIPIAEGSPPGAYRFYGDVSDRVGNVDGFDDAELDARGFPGGFTVVDDDPDTAGPTVTAVRVFPASVDVTSGPQTVTVEVDAQDPSQVHSGAPLLAAADGSSGGAEIPFGFVRVAGTDLSGTWRQVVTIPKHAPAGRWDMTVWIYDRLHNDRRLTPAALADAGFPTGFDVVSVEDVTAPELHSFSVTPAEVNVHDSDQTVTLRARFKDSPAGVDRLYGDNSYGIHLSVFDPVTGQGSGGLFSLRSGTPQDGWFEATVTVPKSSATGARPIDLQVDDEVGNRRFVTTADLVAAGGVPAILVYNVPAPPIPLGVEVGDGTLTVRWDAPVDTGGVPILQYEVDVVGTGLQVTVDGSARSAAVSGLANGMSHQLVVRAVNKAGSSIASTPVRGTPIAPPPRPLPPPPAPAVPSAPAVAVVAATNTTPLPTGYWMIDAGGQVSAFGDALWLGDATSDLATVDLEPTPSRQGYWAVDRSGIVRPRGDARALGPPPSLTPGESVTSLSATGSGAGYWLFTDRGRVLPYGDAPFLGDMSGTRLNGAVLDSVVTPSGSGYFLVAADGGVFTFGDAAFVGSMGATPLNAPVQSLVPDADGVGYWLVAADGGIFAFDAGFHGSMGHTRLNRPVTGMVASPSGDGYLMVGEDGGIFTFGDVAFLGSLGDRPPARPIVAVATR